MTRRSLKYYISIETSFGEQSILVDARMQGEGGERIRRGGRMAEVAGGRREDGGERREEKGTE